MYSFSTQEGIKAILPETIKMIQTDFTNPQVLKPHTTQYNK